MGAEGGAAQGGRYFIVGRGREEDAGRNRLGGEGPCPLKVRETCVRDDGAFFQDGMRIPRILPTSFPIASLILHPSLSALFPRGSINERMRTCVNSVRWAQV